MFTPFSFFFSAFYFLFMYMTLYCPDFYSFWVVMEFSSLLFIGLGYSFMSFGFSNLMLYFVIQALSSVNIFVFYTLSVDTLILFFLFLKLAIFPFFGWFPLVVSKLRNSLFFIVSTFQKFPRIILFNSFLTIYYSPFFILCMLITILCCSLFMFTCFSFRVFLSFSSVGRNSWFILSCICGLDFFLVFFLFYTLNFFLVLFYFGSFFKQPTSLQFSSVITLFTLFISLGGFPPFPIFFMKLYIIYSLSFLSLFSSSLIFALLVLVVYMLSCYMRFSISYIINLFCCPITTLV